MTNSAVDRVNGAVKRIRFGRIAGTETHVPAPEMIFALASFDACTTRWKYSSVQNHIRQWKAFSLMDVGLVCEKGR